MPGHAAIPAIQMIWWRRIFALAFLLASIPFVVSTTITPPQILSVGDLAYERQWNRQFVSIAEYATRFAKTHQRMPNEEEFYDFAVARSIGGPLLDGVRVSPYAEVLTRSPLVAAQFGKPPSGEFILVAPHFDSVEYYASWSGRSTAAIDQPQLVQIEIWPLATRAVVATLLLFFAWRFWPPVRGKDRTAALLLRFVGWIDRDVANNTKPLSMVLIFPPIFLPVIADYAHADGALSMVTAIPLFVSCLLLVSWRTIAVWCGGTKAEDERYDGERRYAAPPDYTDTAAAFAADQPRRKAAPPDLRGPGRAPPANMDVSASPAKPGSWLGAPPEKDGWGLRKSLDGPPRI